MKITLNESEILDMVVEAVDKVVNHYTSINEEDESSLYKELADFLQRFGIESAHVHKNMNNVLSVSVSTDEYHAKKVYNLASKFAERKNLYVNDQWYPATTYITLEKPFRR
jgi:hypothetical protein